MDQSCASTDDLILFKFRSAIKEAYGDRIARVVLYGSRARGSPRPDSDYDIAVFLIDLSDRWAEIERLTEIELDLMDETGANIHATPFPAGAWAERTPLMHEIRREGREL